MRVPEVNAKRVVTTLAWAMAMVLPGGLPMLALWMALKAARGRGAQPAGELASAARAGS